MDDIQAFQPKECHLCHRMESQNLMTKCKDCDEWVCDTCWESDEIVIPGICPFCAEERGVS